MVLYVIAVMGAVILFLIVLLVWLYKRVQELKVEYEEKSLPELPPLLTEPKDHNLYLTVKDVLKLANNEYIEDIDVLVKEYKLETEAPDFYEKYQIIGRINKDKYFQELYSILCAPRKEYVAELFSTYQELSSQDILLMLMCEAKLDNRTISKILFISLDTLKKRKTRLRMKMETDEKEQ